MVKTGESVFNIYQPCWSDKFLNVSNRFIVHANVSLTTQIMFRTKVSHKIEKKFVKTTKNGKNWQVCFQHLATLFVGEV